MSVVVMPSDAGYGSMQDVLECSTKLYSQLLWRRHISGL